MQTIRPSPDASYKNVFNGLTTIIRREGPFGMVRGLNAVACGAGPAHALYFASYEKLKQMLSARPGQNPLANGMCVMIRKPFQSKDWFVSMVCSVYCMIDYHCFMYIVTSLVTLLVIVPLKMF